MSVHGKLTRIYASGYNLSPFLKGMTMGGDADLPDSTTFEDGMSKDYSPGLLDATLEAEGLYDFRLSPGETVDSIEEILTAALNGVGLWTYLPLGDTFGYRGYCAHAINQTFEVEAAVGDLAQVSAEAQSKSGMEPVIILHPLAEEAATANGTTYDAGAAVGATVDGAVAFLHVTAMDAASTATVKIQHSADGTTWADLTTFAAVVTADGPSWERKAVAGTVQRYTRAQVTVTGTGVTFFAALRRN